MPQPLAVTCLKEGTGIPIVFLHGLFGSAQDWEDVCAHLVGHTCYGVDLPGHGNSPISGEFPDFFGKIHLVGYSLGGRIAARLSRKNLATLTLFSTHPGLKTQAERAARWKSDLEWAEKLLTVDDFLKAWYNQPIFAGYRPSDRLRPLKDRRALAEVLLTYSLALMPPLELSGSAICVGERDEKFRALYQSPIVISEAGHAVHLENPKAVAEVLRRNINDELDFAGKLY